MSAVTINIAKDFSRFPAGRYRTDGPYPGERCREDLLVPAIRKHDKVRVELDGTRGYGSSFLEEAFGGLIRVDQFPEQMLRAKLDLVASDTARLEEIWGYIKEAENARQRDGTSTTV